MNQRFASLPGPPEKAIQLLQNVEEWTLWLPGVEQLAVIESSGERQTIALLQSILGHKYELRMEVTPTSAGIRQHQISGWFRRWEAEWRAVAAPDGGTTLSLLLDFELPVLARLAGAQRIRRAIDDYFHNFTRAAGSRLAQARVVPAGEPGKLQLVVFETASGLEIQVNGRTYRLRPER